MSYKDDIQRELKDLGEKLDAVDRDFKLGDTVICTESGVVGEVIKMYTPTSGERQLKVRTLDGRKYHAPINAWDLYGVKGLTSRQFVVDELGIELDAYQEQVLDIMSDRNKRRAIELIMTRNSMRNR